MSGPQRWPDKLVRPDAPDVDAGDLDLERTPRICAWNPDPDKPAHLGACGRRATGLYLVPASLTHPAAEVPTCDLHETIALASLNDNFGKRNVTRHGR